MQERLNRGRVPAVSEVQKMIDLAKELEPKVTY